MKLALLAALMLLAPPFYPGGIYPDDEGTGSGGPGFSRLYGGAGSADGSFEADATDNCANDGENGPNPSVAAMDCDYVPIITSPCDGTQVWRDPPGGIPGLGIWQDKFIEHDELWMTFCASVAVESTINEPGVEMIRFRNGPNIPFSVEFQSNVAQDQVILNCGDGSANIDGGYAVGQMCRYKIHFDFPNTDAEMWCDCGGAAAGCGDDFTGPPDAVCNGTNGPFNGATGHDLIALNNLVYAMLMDDFCYYDGDPDQ